MILVKKTKGIILSMIAILLMTVLAPVGSKVKASTDTPEQMYSETEYQQAVDNLAAIFEEQHENESIYDDIPSSNEELVFNMFTNAFSSDPTESNINKRSLETFGMCFANKMGVTMAKDLVTKVFNRQAVGLLKSFAWKQASAIIAQNITRFASKGVASFLIKQLAHQLLPGIGWGSLALAGAQCGWNEIT